MLQSSLDIYLCMAEACHVCYTINSLKHSTEAPDWETTYMYLPGIWVVSANFWGGSFRPWWMGPFGPGSFRPKPIETNKV